MRRVTDVLVVGCGPVGAAVAHELASCGLDVVVVDRDPVPDSRPRGGLVHARTRQLLARRGLLPEPDRYGSAERSASYHYACREGMLQFFAPADEFGAAPEYWPQAGLVALLEERARALGVTICRGHRVTDVACRDGVYVVDGVCDDESWMMSARWLIGADGAQSVVRRSLEIPVQTSTPKLFGCSILIARDDAASAIPHGWTRMSGGAVGFNLESDTAARVMWVERIDDETDHAREMRLSAVAADPGRFLSLGLSELLSRDSRLRPVAAPTIFSDRRRTADRFSRGRAIVIGDAAHTQSPLGAQGLNLGLSDALGLGWRIAAADDNPARVQDVAEYLTRRRDRAVRIAELCGAQSEFIPPAPRASQRLDTLAGSTDLDPIVMALSGQDDPPAISAEELSQQPSMRSPITRFLTNCSVSTATGEVELSSYLATKHTPSTLHLHGTTLSTRRRPDAQVVRIDPDGCVAPR